MPSSNDRCSLSVHDFLGWILGCDSRDEIHAAVQDWLQANPRPKTMDEILAHVDDMLAGLYQKEYDPRVVAPAVAELAVMAEQFVSESDPIGPREWIDEFIHQPHPSLGGRCPVQLLATPEGVAQVKALLSNRT